ncbi:MAG: hypothetical protein ACK443_07935 [Methylococcaceae bacterium]|jgi:hypothetical protein
MSKSIPFFHVVAGFAGFFLLLFLAYLILETEFFRGDPALGGQETPLRNALTDSAHEYCDKAVLGTLRLGTQPSAAVAADYTAWDIGFSRYLVKGLVHVPNGTRDYLCRINKKGDDPGAKANWQLESLELIP